MDYQDLVKKEREERDRTRIANLQKLIARYGSSRAFSIAISRSPAQIGNMMRGIRPFGDTIKDHIEKTLNLPEGYLDQPVKPEGNVRPLTETESKTTRIPLLSSVQAGCPTDHGDLCYDEWIEVYGQFEEGCYALKITGDSMSPLMDDGDIVVVDPRRWPKPGDCIVARSALENLGEATVKRYYPVGFDESGREVFEARPFNEVYPTMHSVQQKLEVIGTVCKLLKDL
jgi:SOS-response transcriptional repressor LexA